VQAGSGGQAFAAVIKAFVVGPAAERPDRDGVDIAEPINKDAFAGALVAVRDAVAEDKVAGRHVARPDVVAIKARDGVVEEGDVVCRGVFVEGGSKGVAIGNRLGDAAEAEVGVGEAEHVGDGQLEGLRVCQHQTQVLGVFLAGPAGADGWEVFFGEGGEAGPASGVGDGFEYLDEECRVGRVAVDGALGAFGDWFLVG